MKSQLTPERRAVLDERYRRTYYRLAQHAYREYNQTPQFIRAVVLHELPNFRRALELTLVAGHLDEAADFADSVAMFLNVFGRWSERDAMMSAVSDRLAMVGNQGSRIGEQDSVTRIPQSEFIMQSNQGERLLQMGRAGEAEQVFRVLLAKLGDMPSYERSVTLARLGRCLRAQGQQSLAADMYRLELTVLTKLEQSAGVKRLRGAAHTDLADVLAETGQFDAARKEYEIAIEAMKSISDARSMGAVLGQLGTLALRQNDLMDARRRYTDALKTFQRIGEPQGQAVFWHQLGIVAQEARDWNEAERNYKESLAIDERLGNQVGVARTTNQLAYIAESAGRLGEAERWYLRAIQIKEIIGNPKDLVASLTNLSNLYLLRNDVDKAEQFALRAKDIVESLDLSAEPWKIYAILARIAERQGKNDYAQQWHQKEGETYASFIGYSSDDPDKLRQLAHQFESSGDYHRAANLLAVASSIYRDREDKQSAAWLDSEIGGLWITIGRWKDADRILEQSLKLLRQGRDLDRRALTLQRLGLAHHLQGNHEKARLNYRDARRLFIETRNIYGVALVNSCLGQLQVQMQAIDTGLKLLQQSALVHESGDKQRLPSGAQWFQSTL